MNPAYVSAFAALAGALIGGLTSFATSWLTQRTQLLGAQREAERAKLDALYSDFIAEAARLFGDALTHQKDDPSAFVQIIAMVGRMRLASDRTVIDAAMRVEDMLVNTYLGPNRTPPRGDGRRPQGQDGLPDRIRRGGKKGYGRPYDFSGAADATDDPLSIRGAATGASSAQRRFLSARPRNDRQTVSRASLVSIAARRSVLPWASCAMRLIAYPNRAVTLRTLRAVHLPPLGVA